MGIKFINDSISVSVFLIAKLVPLIPIYTIHIENICKSALDVASQAASTMTTPRVCTPNF